MGKFADQFRQEVEAEFERINNQILNMVVDTFNYAVKVSPIQPAAKFSKGEFINSWYPAINGFDTTVSGAYDMTGSGSLSRISGLLGSNAFLGKDAIVSLSNNVSYADKVEYHGWTRTGPYAPIRQAINYYYATYNK